MRHLILKIQQNCLYNCFYSVQNLKKKPLICILALVKFYNLMFHTSGTWRCSASPPIVPMSDRKLGTTITVAYMKNLLKEVPSRINCLDFRILTTSGKN